MLALWLLAGLRCAESSLGRCDVENGTAIGSGSACGTILVESVGDCCNECAKVSVDATPMYATIERLSSLVLACSILAFTRTVQLAIKPEEIVLSMVRMSYMA